MASTHLCRRRGAEPGSGLGGLGGGLGWRGEGGTGRASGRGRARRVQTRVHDGMHSVWPPHTDYTMVWSAYGVVQRMACTIRRCSPHTDHTVVWSAHADCAIAWSACTVVCRPYDALPYAVWVHDGMPSAWPPHADRNVVCGLRRRLLRHRRMHACGTPRVSAKSWVYAIKARVYAVRT